MILALAEAQDRLPPGSYCSSFTHWGSRHHFLDGSGYRRFYLWSKKISRYTTVITFFSGLLLIGVGVLLFTDRFTLLSMYLNKVLGGRSLEDLLLLD